MEALGVAEDVVEEGEGGVGDVYCAGGVDGCVEGEGDALEQEEDY